MDPMTGPGQRAKLAEPWAFVLNVEGDSEQHRLHRRQMGLGQIEGGAMGQ